MAKRGPLRSRPERASARIPREVKGLLLPLYEKRCPCRMRFDPKEGLIPRGVCGARKRLEDVRLVVVAQNPGRPRNRESYTLGQGPEALLDGMVAFCEEYHLKRGKDGLPGRSAYHQRLMALLMEALGANADEVLDQVYFTELVKCSGETGRGFPPENDGRSDFAPCRKVLDKELDLFPSAKAIVALGRNVWLGTFLRSDHKVVGVPHPTKRGLTVNRYLEECGPALKTLKDLLA